MVVIPCTVLPIPALLYKSVPEKQVVKIRNYTLYTLPRLHHYLYSTGLQTQ
jgi:hypothetical protein